MDGNIKNGKRKSIMSKKKLVVLTGAGISAESGIQTFRGSDGLWEGHEITDVASPVGWAKNPALVLEFYNMRRKAVLQAQPNKAHDLLAKLEDYFDVSIITQNIDDLHERAGSTQITHLHGEIFKMRSEQSLLPNYEIISDIFIGDKAPDGYQLRPDIVWFGEAVPKIEEADIIASQADIFVVIGTSLIVYPAAGIIHSCMPHIDKYIIDTHIPKVSGVSNLTKIEASATMGVQQLFDILTKF